MNPYSKTLVDELSGVEVPNDRWKAWEEGRRAGIGEVASKFHVTNPSAPGGWVEMEIRSYDWQIITEAEQEGK